LKQQQQMQEQQLSQQLSAKFKQQQQSMCCGRLAQFASSIGDSHNTAHHVLYGR
jgi:hypothetical protein